MVKVAILVGGKTRGSNMEAIALACANGSVPAKVTIVIAPHAESPAMDTATRLKLPTAALSSKEEDYENKLVHALREADADYVCLCGYLSLLPELVLRLFPNRVLNIHPALLPKFGGKGMYGIRVHQAVVAAREVESGCTVHLVTNQYDEGEVLLQKTCPVLPEDTPETLATRVLFLEHAAYPEALKKLILRNGT